MGDLYLEEQCSIYLQGQSCLKYFGVPCKTILDDMPSENVRDIGPYCFKHIFQAAIFYTVLDSQLLNQVFPIVA